MTSLMVACGGSTTIDFVGEPGTGGDDMGGSGGSDSSGGTDGSGGTDVGGMGGDGSGGGAIIIAPYCGDGLIDEDSEACDDGNERSGDGCAFDCEVEEPFVCSGEPSECTTVGNGTLDSGEECDDGNTDDDDGCSSGGTVEGTCEEPAVLSAEDDGSGVITATVTVDTSAGGGNVAAAACGGLSLGAGSDRVYRVDLPPGTFDLNIAMESDFDGIMRLYGGSPDAACDPEQEGVCVDDVGARAVETFELHGMEGSFFVAVDGAEEGEVGEFTLTVSSTCFIDHLKLHRLGSYKVFPPVGVGLNHSVLSLKNTSDYCSLDLSEAGLALTDDGGTGPLAVELPQQVLPPQGVFRASLDVDPAINPNSFDVPGTLTFFDSVASAAYLCEGPCDQVEATNVIDAMSVGGAAPIPGVTVPVLPNLVLSPHVAYVRVAYDGAYPTFAASDWSVAFTVDPDDFSLLLFSHRIQTLTLSPLAAVADATQGTVLRVPARADNSDYSYYSADIPAAVTNPTYISYKYKQPVSSDILIGCYLGFGMEPGAAVPVDSASWDVTKGLHHSYSEPYYGDVYFSGYGWTYQDDETWHQVEITDINYTDHTLTLTQDGVQLDTGVLFWNEDTLTNVMSLSPYGQNTDCDYTDVVVRNGPPGRIWESSPVLP